MGKYLVALSTSLGKVGGPEGATSGNTSKSTFRRKQLHVLYLLSDLLHHVKYHNSTSSALGTVTSALQPSVGGLVGTAAAYDLTVYVKHGKRLSVLIDEWEIHKYYDPDYIQTLRDTLTNAFSKGQGEIGNGVLVQHASADGEDKNRLDVPFIMPAAHGDHLAPYYDLPAANMMPHIIPNSATPIDPHQVRPLQFTPGPADETLVLAMRDFFKDVDALYGQNQDSDEGISLDYDELGQSIIHDEGETVGGEAYYGWSKAFCEKMKMRRDGKAKPNVRGADDSPEGSLSPRKRRRYSSSERSRSPVQRRRDSYSSQGFRNRSRTRTQSPAPRFNRSRPLQSRSRTRSYSPPIDLSSNNVPPPPPPQTQHYSQDPSSIPLQPFPNSFPQGLPLGPNGVPIPPPPPPNYTGIWPPPPPPPPPAALSLHNGSFQGAPFVPPPPPVLPSYGQQAVIPRDYQGSSPVPGWAAQEQASQYGGAAGYRGGGGGYGRSPPQGQRGVQYNNRGRGGRGGWRG